VEHSDARVTVTHAGQVIVDSRRCLRVLETSHPPVYYVPGHDVAAGVLVAGAGRSYCEFKGTAAYWDLAVGTSRVTAAAWSYERPRTAYALLTGALAFYPSRLDECRVDGELVEAQEGDFYGGWITKDISGPFKGGPDTAGW
jgi:uncharacterized protein (DUF427 family)